MAPGSAAEAVHLVSSVGGLIGHFGATGALVTVDAHVVAHLGGLPLAEVDIDQRVGPCQLSKVLRGHYVAGWAPAHRRKAIKLRLLFERRNRSLGKG